MRTSPSGPPNLASNPFPGSTVLVASSTRYQNQGSLSAPLAAEVDTQLLLTKASRIESLRVQIIFAGADTVDHTWNVRRNGVLIPGLTITLTGDVVAGAEVVPSSVAEGVLSEGDLISLEIVSGAIVGASPQFRTFVNFEEDSRQSPSGPPTSNSNQFPGANTLVTAATRYMSLGSPAAGSVATQIEAQYYVPKAGKILEMGVNIITAGTEANTHTWAVLINGTPVDGLTVALIGNVVAGEIVGPDAVTTVAEGDLVSLRIITGTISGTSPRVRTFVVISEE